MLIGALYLLIFFILLSFVVSELTRNYSQVDKLWSITPLVYLWYYAGMSAWDPRITLMALLVTVWGLRLSFNFWRRGGYGWPPWSGDEDYRWAVLRKNKILKRRWVWILFNFFFICVVQHGILFLITLPAWFAAESSRIPLGALDWIAAILVLGFVGMETLADEQQYLFQTEKHRRIKKKETLKGEYKNGFRSSGLFALVRHPNFAAEQMIWLSFYFFSVAATGEWINISLVGALSLILLFQGSTNFTEKISLGKYPAYADYQRRIPRFIPRMLGRASGMHGRAATKSRPGSRANDQPRLGLTSKKK